MTFHELDHPAGLKVEHGNAAVYSADGEVLACKDAKRIEPGDKSERVEGCFDGVGEVLGERVCKSLVSCECRTVQTEWFTLQLQVHARHGSRRHLGRSARSLLSCRRTKVDVRVVRGPGYGAPKSKVSSVALKRALRGLQPRQVESW